MDEFARALALAEERGYERGFRAGESSGYNRGWREGMSAAREHLDKLTSDVQQLLVTLGLRSQPPARLPSELPPDHH